VEREWFDHLEQYFEGKPQADRVKTARGIRRRAWLDEAANGRAHAFMPGMLPRGNQVREASIDLVALVSSVDLEPEAREQVDARLAPYVGTLTDVRVQRLATELEGQREVAV